MNRQDYILLANDILRELREHSDETDAQLSDRIARRLQELSDNEYNNGFLNGSEYLGVTRF